MTSCLHMNDKYNLAKLQDDKEKIERLIAHQSRRIGHVFPKEMEHEFWAKNLERARKHVEKYVWSGVLVYFIFIVVIVPTDYFIPLFGLTPKLGPIANWGLEIEKNAIKVNNALDYQTNIEGIYAIGDVNIYPGKLKLILCGFHEATLMCQSVYNRLNPGKRYVLKYTTVSGIDGFDGTRKEAEKAVVKSID